MTRKPESVIFSGDGQKRDLLAYCDKEDSVYFAIITPNFVEEEKCILEARDAAAKGLKMYGFLLSATKMPKELRKLKWQKIIPCSDSEELSRKAKQVLKELGVDN